MRRSRQLTKLAKLGSTKDRLLLPNSYRQRFSRDPDIDSTSELLDMVEHILNRRQVDIPRLQLTTTFTTSTAIVALVKGMFSSKDHTQDVATGFVYPSEISGRYQMLRTGCQQGGGLGP